MTFDSLDFVVIDASALFSIQSDLLTKILDNPQVCVCMTQSFEDVYLSLDQFVPTYKKKQGKRNYGILKEWLANLADNDDSFLCHPADYYDLAFLLSKEKDNTNSMIITANEILIDRIILNNLGVYIYNPARKCFYNYQSFTNMSNMLALHYKSNPIPYQGECNAGMTLYTSNGSLILSNKFSDGVNEGAESEIFRIRDIPSKIVKIYKEEVLTEGKLSNIEQLRVLGAANNISWCTLPIDLVYFDVEKKHPVGYTMKYYQNITMLTEIALFNGNANDILPNYRNTCICDTLEICIKFVRQIMYLNLNGVLVSDFNDNNFAFFRDSHDPYVVFLDTDSFGYKDYFSDCRADYEYVHNYTFGSMNKSDAVLFSQEALYVFIFKLLTLGQEPIVYGEFVFCSNRDNHNFDYRWNLIPRNLQALFIKAFENKAVCSIDELLYELLEAKDRLKRNSELNKTYRELCSEQIYPFRADALFESVSGVLYSNADITPRKLIICCNAISGICDGSPQIGEEKWQKSEIIFFIKNTDNTYYIKNLEDDCYLSISGTLDKAILSYSATQHPSYSEKWRIQKESSYIDNKGYQFFSCIISSEYYPQMRLVVDENDQIKVMSKYDSAIPDSKFTICLITSEQHCSNNSNQSTNYVVQDQTNNSQPANMTVPPVKKSLDNDFDQLRLFLSDVFSPNGKKWDTVGKRIVVVLCIIILLCVLIKSCSQEKDTKVDVTLEYAEEVTNTIVFNIDDFFEFQT